MSQLNLSTQLVDQMHEFLIQHDENAQDPGVASQYMCAVVGCLLGKQEMPESQKEEIIEFDKYEDLKSFVAARYLGICLNCMGLKLRDKRSYETALHKSVLRWAKRNFRELHENHPTVANACLMGGITYDIEENRLVKTYAERADREPDREYLTLD